MDKPDYQEYRFTSGNRENDNHQAGDEGILSIILDAFPFYVVLVDENHHIILANKALRNVLGLEQKQLFGGYCPKLVHGLDKPFPGCPLEQAKEQNKEVIVEVFDPKSKSWLNSAVCPTGLSTRDGQRIFLHSVQDITEKKRAGQDLERSYQVQIIINQLLKLSLETGSLEELFERTLDLITPIPWIALESKGSIFLVENEPQVLVTKVQRGLMKALVTTCARVPFGHCLCGRAAVSGEIEFADCVDHRHEILYEGISAHGHYCVPIMYNNRTLGVINLYLKEGHLFDKKEAEFLTAVANTLAGVIVRKRSDEDKKKVEIQLYHSQRVEAVGRLASGVAHDFNNLLAIISGYSELLLNKVDKNFPFRDSLEEISKAAEKSARLTKQLLAFSRKQVLVPEILDLNEVVTDFSKMLQRIIGEDIKLVTNLSSSLEKVKVDRGQIEQVIMNLVVNARDAMHGGGTVTIRTENIVLDESSARLTTDARPGKFECLSVADTGVGISKPVLEHLFEPFFTTKETGKGTGLGLSVVFGIVKQHEGWINVYSDPGQGALFKIYLPANKS